MPSGRSDFSWHGLTLLQLAKKYAFTCVRCEERRKGVQLALERGRWTETVCWGCFDDARRGRPPKDLLRRHVQPVASFFRAANVPIHYDHGWVKVRGKRAFKARGLKQRLGKREWQRLIDRVVFADCPDVLVSAMRRNAAGLGENVRAYFDREAQAFEVRRGIESLGTIRPTRAEIYGEAPVVANFLIDGEHWVAVARAVERRDQRLARRAERRAQQRAAMPHEPQEQWLLISSPPAGLAEEMVAECLAASADIRLHRSIAYAHPVVLALGESSIRFAPIDSSGSGLFVPLELRRNERAVKGELAVQGDRDPLRVRLAPPVHDDLIALAWSTALLGFAAATCFSIEPPMPRPRPAEMQPQRRSGIRRSRLPQQSRPPTVPRRRLWPGHLQPVGAWSTRAPSFVPGHRRRLGDGRTASAEARERARRVGITLGPHETWVQPHARGLLANEELSFLWRAPSVLSNLA